MTIFSFFAYFSSKRSSICRIMNYIDRSLDFSVLQQLSQQLIDFLQIRLSLECLHRLTDEETEYLLVARAVLRNVLFASGKHVGKNLLISGIIADDFQSMRLEIAFDVLPAVKGIGKHLSCALAAESACGNSGNDCTQSLST